MKKNKILITCARGITPFLREELLLLGFQVTSAIEAALAGLNRASGVLRDNFGFMHLKGFNQSLWKELRTRAIKTAKKTLDCRIIATDISRDAVEAARKNAAMAGVEQLIEFSVCDYSGITIPDGKGIYLQEILIWQKR